MYKLATVYEINA